MTEKVREKSVANTTVPCLTKRVFPDGKMKRGSHTAKKTKKWTRESRFSSRCSHEITKFAEDIKCYGKRAQTGCFRVDCRTRMTRAAVQTFEFSTKHQLDGHPFRYYEHCALNKDTQSARFPFPVPSGDIHLFLKLLVFLCV